MLQLLQSPFTQDNEFELHYSLGAQYLLIGQRHKAKIALEKALIMAKSSEKHKESYDKQKVALILGVVYR